MWRVWRWTSVELAPIHGGVEGHARCCRPPNGTALSVCSFPRARRRAGIKPGPLVLEAIPPASGLWADLWGEPAADLVGLAFPRPSGPSSTDARPPNHAAQPRPHSNANRVGKLTSLPRGQIVVSYILARPSALYRQEMRCRSNLICAHSQFCPQVFS